MSKPINITPLVRIIRALDYGAALVVGTCSAVLFHRWRPIPAPRKVYQVYVSRLSCVFSGPFTFLPEHVYDTEADAQHVSIMLTAQAANNRIDDLYLYREFIVRSTPNLTVVTLAKPAERN